MNLSKLQEIVKDGGVCSLACCSLWGYKESGMTLQLHNNVRHNVTCHIIFILYQVYNVIVCISYSVRIQ